MQLSYPLRHPKTLALALATLFLTAPSAHADTVTLTNGDRLTGQVLLMDAGALVLSTDYAGEIRIAWNKVAQLLTDNPMMLRGKGLPKGYEARLVAAGQLENTATLQPTGKAQASAASQPTTSGVAQAHTVILQPTGATEASTAPTQSEPSRQVPLADIGRLVRPNAFLRDWSFDGGVDLALNATHASSSNQNFSVGLHASARRDLWRHGLKMDYTRKTQDSVVGTYNYNAAYMADRFFSEKLFVRGRLRYGRDQIDNPAHQYVFALGPGYQFWDNELGSFSVSGFLTQTHHKYHDNTSDNFQTIGLGWQFTRYLAGKQWQVFTTGELNRAFKGGSDYSLEAELGLRYSVTQWMSLYAKAGYDRITMQGKKPTNERKYSVGLGVNW